MDAVGRPLPRVDAAAVALEAEHQAREHRLIVEQDGARAAFAELAAVLGAAEIQVLTQHLEERFVRRERDLGRFAVDRRVLAGARPARVLFACAAAPACGCW